MSIQFIKKEINGKEESLLVYNGTEYQIDEFSAMDKNNIANILTNILKSSNHIGSKFEPIINHRTMEIEKYEVLMDVSDDLKNFLIQERRGENFGLITNLLENKNYSFGSDLTMKHLENIKTHVGILKNEGINREYGINISEADIENVKFGEWLENNPETAQKMELEILESISNQYLKRNINKLKKFVQPNLVSRIKIDDYGSGENNYKRVLFLKNELGDKLASVKFDKEFAKYIGMFNNNANIKKIYEDEIKDFGLLIKKFIKYSNNNKDHLALNEFQKIFMLFDIMAKSHPDLETLNTDKIEVKTEKRVKLAKMLEDILLKDDVDKEGNPIKKLKSFKEISENKEFNQHVLQFMYQKHQKVISEMEAISGLASVQNLNLVCEYIEDPKAMANLITYFPQIKYLQGYVINANGKECDRMVEGIDVNMGNIESDNILKRYNSEPLKIESVLKGVTEHIFQNCLDSLTEQRRRHMQTLTKNPNIKINKNTAMLHPSLFKIIENYLSKNNMLEGKELTSSTFNEFLKNNKEDFIKFFLAEKQKDKIYENIKSQDVEHFNKFCNDYKPKNLLEKFGYDEKINQNHEEDRFWCMLKNIQENYNESVGEKEHVPFQWDYELGLKIGYCA